MKRAGLARAMALDPDILYFDEPSAGLDPISSRLLDDLILEIRNSLGVTVVIVTHELATYLPGCRQLSVRRP
jgi:phospholipid/cholesterol/gamma-HCH transport system ATP-binding protein